MATPESIIGEKGDIALILPPDEVTWFSVLHASRAANSERGGWNSATHWGERGLKALLGGNRIGGFLEKWTHASLKSSSPTPRQGDFRIKARKNALAKGKRGSTDSPPHGSENLLNWNLSQKIFQEIVPQSEGQRCVTYELPLAADSDGQLKADIVVFSAGGFIEIIELKRSGIDGNPDRPLMALVEAICYTLQLLRCWSQLKEDLPPKLRLDQPSTINVVLAAPEYWSHCNGRGKAIEREQVSALREIVSNVEGALKAQRSFPAPSLLLTLAEVIDEGRGGLRSISLNPLDDSIRARSVVGA